MDRVMIPKETRRLTRGTAGGVYLPAQIVAFLNFSGLEAAVEVALGEDRQGRPLAPQRIGIRDARGIFPFRQRVLSVTKVLYLLEQPPRDGWTGTVRGGEFPARGDSSAETI